MAMKRGSLGRVSKSVRGCLHNVSTAARWSTSSLPWISSWPRQRPARGPACHQVLYEGAEGLPFRQLGDPVELW